MFGDALNEATRINRFNSRRTELAGTASMAPATSGGPSGRGWTPAGTDASHLGLAVSRTISSITASHGSHSGR
jgi:hypothetical protein